MITKQQMMYVLNVTDEEQFDNLLLLSGCVTPTGDDYTEVLKSWIEEENELYWREVNKYNKLREDYCTLKEFADYATKRDDGRRFDDINIE